MRLQLYTSATFKVYLIRWRASRQVHPLNSTVSIIRYECVYNSTFSSSSDPFILRRVVSLAIIYLSCANFWYIKISTKRAFDTYNRDVERRPSGTEEIT